MIIQEEIYQKVNELIEGFTEAWRKDNLGSGRLFFTREILYFLTDLERVHKLFIDELKSQITSFRVAIAISKREYYFTMEELKTLNIISNFLFYLKYDLGEYDYE